MALFHHDSRSYDEAATEAAARARAMMEREIERGRANAARVLHDVATKVPEDRLARARALNFIPVDTGVEISVAGDSVSTPIHDHALGQIASRGGIPMGYVRSLLDAEGEWGAKLLAHNLNDLYRQGKGADGRYLCRSLDGELRGFLSDRYRRMDCRPIVDAFCAMASEHGAVPINGYSLETKIAIKALLPVVFEPVPNEVMAFGLALENSDYGDGALSIRLFMLRLWCTNYAIAEDALRKVHLGRRLTDDFSYSDQTHQLDQRATVSAIKDVTGELLSPDRVNRACGLIRRANEEEVSPLKIKSFLKKHLNKGEGEAVTEAFNSADVVNLPPGNTAWRLSNAISWVAGNMDNQARALDLMKVAGKVVNQ